MLTNYDFGFDCEVCGSILKSRDRSRLVRLKAEKTLCYEHVYEEIERNKVIQDNLVYVYHLYSVDALLYVGMSKNLKSRIKNHRDSKMWWDRVVSYGLSGFGTVDQAREFESWSIRLDNPWFNQSRPVPGIEDLPLPVQRVSGLISELV